ncbi:hypothetical protein BDY21DRAFT_349606 [Lineolata rhizophorae]|uniref:Uncharacterized protein n=1 Tax=Lineolata rhizophorae TaxID=578093 RepID=A0A6A6NW91_9PEZI|nr:hypothetical protein BDY21DRAFT_349606 [Lineolata rhizophorae]
MALFHRSNKFIVASSRSCSTVLNALFLALGSCYIPLPLDVYNFRSRGCRMFDVWLFAGQSSPHIVEPPPIAESGGEIHCLFSVTVTSTKCNPGMPLGSSTPNQTWSGQNHHQTLAIRCTSNLISRKLLTGPLAVTQRLTTCNLSASPNQTGSTVRILPRKSVFRTPSMGAALPSRTH